MRSRFFLSVLFLIYNHASLGQSWTGSHSFTGSIDLLQWTKYSDTNNLIQNASGFSVISGSNSGSVDTGLEYNSLLPSHADWSITATMQIRSAFTANTNGWLEGYMGVSSLSDWNHPDHSYFLGSLFKPWDESQPLADSYWRINGGTQNFGAVEVADSQDVQIRMDYSASSQSLLAYYRTSSAPSFTPLSSHNTATWTNLNGFVLVIGGHVTDTTAADGDLTIKSIEIVPEPSSFSLLLLGLGVILRRPSRRL